VECISTAQVGVSLAAPLDSLFKRSNLRSLHDRDMIITLMACRSMMMVSTWKVCSSCHVFSAPASSIVECAPAPVAEWTEPIQRWQDLPSLDELGPLCHGRAAVCSAVGAGGDVVVKCGCMQLCCVGARPGVKSWRNMVQVAANTKTNLCPSSSCDCLSFLVICLFVCL